MESTSVYWWVDWWFFCERLSRNWNKQDPLLMEPLPNFSCSQVAKEVSWWCLLPNAGSAQCWGWKFTSYLPCDSEFSGVLFSIGSSWTCNIGITGRPLWVQVFWLRPMKLDTVNCFKWTCWSFKTMATWVFKSAINYWTFILLRPIYILKRKVVIHFAWLFELR